MSRIEDQRYWYGAVLEFLTMDEEKYYENSPQPYIFGQWRERSDVVKVVRQQDGWRQPSAYSLTVLDNVPWSGECVFVTYDSKKRMIGPSIYLDYRYPRHAIDVPQWLVTKAENKALIKLKNANVHYAVALSEIHKSFGLGRTVRDAPKGTLAFAVAAVGRVSSAYQSARKGRWSDALRHLGITKHKFRTSSKDSAGRWLELQYGWLPLLQDVSGSWDDFRKGFLAHRPRFSVRAVVKEKLPVELPDVESVMSYGNTAKCKRVEGLHSVTVRLDYQVDDTHLRNLAQVGLTDPLSVAWENVPYSFVVDWIVPVGNFLEALPATQGMVFKGGSVTRYAKSHIRMTPGHRGSFNPVVRFTGSAEQKWVSFTRTVLSQSPIPGLYVKNPISTAHLINALALVRQRFR